MYFELFPVFQEIATCSGTASLEKQISENSQVRQNNNDLVIKQSQGRLVLPEDYE